jgi:hypothetical protein
MTTIFGQFAFIQLSATPFVQTNSVQTLLQKRTPTKISNSNCLEINSIFSGTGLAWYGQKNYKFVYDVDEQPAHVLSEPEAA